MKTADSIRVLAVCHEDPEVILGGMGRHVRHLYQAMAKIPGVEIDLLTTGPREGSRQYLGYTKHHNDKLICWKPRQADFACQLSQDVQVLRTFCRLLAQGRQWDIVHMHEWGAVQVGRVARDALGVPLVGTLHLCMKALADQCEAGAESMFEGEHSFGSLAEGDLYMRQQEGHLVWDPDELILCSNAYVDLIRKVYLTERPINMIYNGIDVSEWNPETGGGVYARARNEIPQRPVALYAGRIADMKGIRDVLTAVESHDSGYCVVLAGEVNANSDEAKEQWEVTRWIRRLEAEMPERLRWVGFQDGQYLRDFYSLADVVLMPSNHEPFGLVALEAMAMGTPLISTEVGGLGEIVKDGRKEYAMIIPPHSPEAIVKALEVLKDEKVRAELRELGLSRACDFTWDEAARMTVDVYRQAIENRLAQEVAVCQ